MKGPQYYVNAVKQMFSGRYPGTSMEVNCGVLHTTEGTGWPSYSGGAVAPTLTMRPDFKARKLEVRQHFKIDESARALVNKAGGVDTNTANAFQVELVGTCDPKTHAKWEKAGYSHIYWADPPLWALRDVAELMVWLYENHGVPLKSGLRFVAYPASYGATKTRMTHAKWRKFKGWCGHQHVPENTHGDPGGFPIEEALELANAKLRAKRKKARGK